MVNTVIDDGRQTLSECGLFVCSPGLAWYEREPDSNQTDQVVARYLVVDRVIGLVEASIRARVQG